MSDPEYPVRSPLTFEPAGDRALVRVADGPASSQELMQYDGPRRDWCAELGIPYMDELDKLEALAQARGFSPRGFDCVLLDEGLTRFRMPFRHHPRKIVFREGDHYRLTLSHTGLIIGSVGNIRLAAPGEVDGESLIAQARLYDSELAGLAWLGILRGIFTAICAVTVRLPTADIGTGELVEVALADVSAVPNARITKLWIDIRDQQQLQA